MTVLKDPAAAPIACRRAQKRLSIQPKDDFSALSYLRKSAPVPFLSSILRSSVSRAGDAWNSLRDGLSKEARDKVLYVEERKRILYLRLQNAETLNDWLESAGELDELEGNNAWKADFESNDYDPLLVQTRLRELEKARTGNDVGAMVHLVRTSFSRDLGNMTNPKLYKRAHVGTKDLIDKYITTASDTLTTLLEVSEKNGFDGGESKYILEQLLAARQAFGRSALLLSGGATFGMNHIGVVKALWETRLLPRIISGSSAGSIVTAVLCAHTDDEMPEIFSSIGYGDFSVFESNKEEQSALNRITRFLKHGSFFDIGHLTRVMQDLLGDMTFQEAYNRTRRILNICVSNAGLYELPRLLNYITAPNVLVWSAVATSCCVPLVFSSSSLMAKDPITGEIVPWNQSPQRWIDGSVDNDLPMARLSEMFNVNHFIVSQVNPHVVPFIPQEETFLFSGPSGTGALEPSWLRSLTGLAREEALHRMHVLSEIGILPNTLRKLASIMSQKYSGDINILPQITYELFPNILKNPTTDFMLQASLCGERATWPKLGRIRNHCAIELALDCAVQIMRARVTLQPTHPSSGTFPYRMSGVLGTNNRTRASIVRRRSHGSESDRIKNGQHHISRRPIHNLRKSRSSVSAYPGLGIVYAHLHNDVTCDRADLDGSASKFQPTHTHRGFAVGSDSEDETEVPSADSKESVSPDPSDFVNVSPWESSKSSPIVQSNTHRASVGYVGSIPARSPKAVQKPGGPEVFSPALNGTPSPKQGHRRRASYGLRFNC